MRIKLPRIRISLRAFLILGTIVRSGSSLVIRSYMRERAAEDQLIQNGLYAFRGDDMICASYDNSEAKQRQRAYETFFGRLHWELFRHVRIVKRKTMTGTDSPENVIDDNSLVPLRDLRHVEKLWLESCSITNEGLSHLGHLRSLVILNLAGTKINDDGLHSIANLTNLEYLELANTNVSDSGLQHLGRLQRLREINLRGTKVTGPGLTHIANLKNLEGLYFSDNAVRSEDLQHLTGLRKLIGLRLSNSSIDDSAAPYIAQFTDLGVLFIDNTNIGDEFIANIASLKCILSLDLRGTRVTNASTDTICSFEQLQWFSGKDTAMDDDAQERVRRFTVANLSALVNPAQTGTNPP